MSTTFSITQPPNATSPESPIPPERALVPAYYVITAYPQLGGTVGYACMGDPNVWPSFDCAVDMARFLEIGTGK